VRCQNSESDSELATNTWFDSESDFTEVSTINTSPNQGVKMGEISSIQQNTMAIGVENDCVAGLVSNRDYDQVDDVTLARLNLIQEANF